MGNPRSATEMCEAAPDCAAVLVAHGSNYTGRKQRCHIQTMVSPNVLDDTKLVYGIDMDMIMKPESVVYKGFFSFQVHSPLQGSKVGSV